MGVETPQRHKARSQRVIEAPQWYKARSQRVIEPPQRHKARSQWVIEAPQRRKASSQRLIEGPQWHNARSQQVVEASKGYKRGPQSFKNNVFGALRGRKVSKTMFLAFCGVAKSQKRCFWRFARSQSLKNDVFGVLQGRKALKTMFLILYPSPFGDFPCNRGRVRIEKTIVGWFRRKARSQCPIPGRF